MPRKPGLTPLTPESLGWKPITQEIASSDPVSLEISNEKYRELAFKVLTALNAGLVERLIRNPQSRSAGQWLKERFLDERWFRTQAYRLAQIERTYENGAAIVDSCLTGIASRIAVDRPPRKNARVCNWVALRLQYDEAVRTWLVEKAAIPIPRIRRTTKTHAAEEVAQGHKKTAAKVAWAQTAAKVAWKWSENLYASFLQPNLKCDCKGKSDPPSEAELSTWLTEPGDEMMIVGVLSHYHGLTSSAVRWLLDEASRQIKRWPSY